MKIGDLLHVLYTLSPEREVFGRSCQPIKVVVQNDGNVLVSEESATREEIKAFEQAEQDTKLDIDFPPGATLTAFRKIKAVKGAIAPEPEKIVISVYVDDGNVFDYDVLTVQTAREHVSAIIATGYRHTCLKTPDVLVHFPPHRIVKVKMTGPGITTNYHDRPRGT